MSPVRVRFAPSPTGFFHVGSARTALFNWLFARQQGGVFILRIEDTDTERNREEWVDGIRSAMSWLGLEPDEGPYRQSERSERYRAAIDALWENGYLYACDCTRDQVEERTAKNAVPGYDGYCRDRRLGRDGPGRALRFRSPDDGATVVADIIRGDVTFPHAAMEDFVVVKSSGQPLFVLANTVDDRDMGITHVIRGEDLLPTTPKGLLLWKALDASEGALGDRSAVGDRSAAGDRSAVGDRSAPGGATARGGEGELPVFAHLPMLVNEHGKKLSKRRDPVAVEAYREQGFLPEAFRNYLALLGWSPPGNAERVPVDVLIAEFRLEDVHRAPAQFDVRKLTHFNGEYIRQLSVDEFVERSRPWLAPPPSGWRPALAPPWSPDRFSEEAFGDLAPLVQERVARLDEVPAMVDFVFLADPPVDEASWKKAVAGDEAARSILTEASAAYGRCEWTPDGLRAATEAVADRAGRKLGKAQAPIRVAVTGRSIGPPLFESLVVVGRDEVLRRLEAAIGRLVEGSADPGGGQPGRTD